MYLKEFFQFRRWRQRRHKEIFPFNSIWRIFNPSSRYLHNLLVIMTLASLPYTNIKRFCWKKSQDSKHPHASAHTQSLYVFPKKQKARFLYSTTSIRIWQETSLIRPRRIFNEFEWRTLTQEKERCTHSDFDWNKRRHAIFFLTHFIHLISR